MNKCKVTNLNNGKTVEADVLQRSDKRLRVALTGTNITINLTREDVRKPFIGRANGLEFSSMG
jgi:hypothetical protein